LKFFILLYQWTVPPADRRFFILDAWEKLNNDISRPFDKPSSGRIAVKVINHLGDEVMKVFRVD
jgi:hypothetical protein